MGETTTPTPLLFARSANRSGGREAAGEDMSISRQTLIASPPSLRSGTPPIRAAREQEGSA